MYDLTNKRFGRLVAIKRVEDYIHKNGYRASQWLCKCDCGNDVIVRTKALTKKNNPTKSCGCLQKESVKKYNTYDLSGDYGIGYTQKGEEFYFDLEDYDKIKDYCWFITDKGYVRSTDLNNNFKPVQFHRIVMGNPDGNYDIDHKHGKSSRNDNRKLNLRIVTRSQNGMNSKRAKNNTSGVTGVNWDKRRNKWNARIGVNYVRIHLGNFDNFDDAVKARKEAEEKYFGEYSYDNSMKTEVA